MEKDLPPLTSYSEELRQRAMDKYRVIAPYLNHEESLKNIAEESGIPKRTLYHWINQYRQSGLKGLVRKKRSDSGSFKVKENVQEEIKKLIFKYRKNSLTSIHRKICIICEIKNWEQPSYSQVYTISKSLSPQINELAHKGKKEYQNNYDLIYRRECHYSNEIWQADHTPLDILVLNEKGKPERPWLTIILDDYSRAVAGYFLSFQDPSAIQTSLVLHQAIWKKSNSDWQICGMPETFYTDHGSDFTSNHLEQVAIDLKINLIFSTVGMPRGRGKIERFFLTINQLFLQDLPGYFGNQNTSNLLTIKELDEKLACFIIYDYHHRIHGTTKQEPIKMWNNSGFLPNLPDSLESLDLLLLNVAKSRKVHSDGIHFQGLRYIDTNLAAYVGETVIIRYDPRDIAEIRVFYKDQYLCTAISPEISDYEVDLKEIVAARNKARKNLENQLHSGNNIAEELISTKQKELDNPVIKKILRSQKLRGITMIKTPYFIETKEYKRFVEFCRACIKYKYIGICYGLPGVGKTLSAKQYSNWNWVEKQIDYKKSNEIGMNADKKILEAKTIFYTAPAIRATKMTNEIDMIGGKMGMVKSMYRVLQLGAEEKYSTNAYEEIDLIIIDEIDRLKVQHLEQLRDIYDQNDLAIVFIGMPGIENRLARYPQLYSRIGFAHEFDRLSKDEIHHILEYKWEELGLSVQLEDFANYEAVTSIIKITSGNFRLIQRLFTQIERILEINNLETITTEVVEAARDSLVIGVK